MFEHLFTCKHPTSDSDAYGNAYEINFNFHFKLWFFALSPTLLGNNMNSTHFPANFYSLLIPSCSLNAFHRVFAAFTGSYPMHLLSLLSLRKPPMLLCIWLTINLICPAADFPVPSVHRPLKCTHTQFKLPIIAISPRIRHCATWRILNSIA